ncbi:MAG TPA: hypothetical protein VGN72_01220 [Tepidisphaeraceae bacterium]|jgi:hypothetical protein|nr:hypothetical protein [Tepidisphaeraceae bacterium]
MSEMADGKTRIASSTCLIGIGVGDEVLDEDGRRVRVEAFHLTPNGAADTSLVCLIVGRVLTGHNAGGRMQATSTRFRPVPENAYREFYPSSVFFDDDAKAEGR